MVLRRSSDYLVIILPLEYLLGLFYDFVNLHDALQESKFPKLKSRRTFQLGGFSLLIDVPKSFPSSHAFIGHMIIASSQIIPLLQAVRREGFRDGAQ